MKKCKSIKKSGIERKQGNKRRHTIEDRVAPIQAHLILQFLLPLCAVWILSHHRMTEFGFCIIWKKKKHALWSQQSIYRPAWEWQDRGTRLDSTSRMDKMSSNTRRGCIHIDHRVSCGPQGTEWIPLGEWGYVEEIGDRTDDTNLSLVGYRFGGKAGWTCIACKIVSNLAQGPWRWTLQIFKWATYRW